MLDLLAQVLAALPGVRLQELPRMADFARILAAPDAVTGWDTLANYTAAAHAITDAVLDADPLGTAVGDLVATQVVGWTGTAAELSWSPRPGRRPARFPA